MSLPRKKEFFLLKAACLGAFGASWRGDCIEVTAYGYSDVLTHIMPYLPQPTDGHLNSAGLHRSGTLSGKSGVDICTAVHPMATPLNVLMID